MVQVRGGNYHVARCAYSLYSLQDLDLDAVDHGEGPADGAHVATIPAGLVAHHGAAQPVYQFGRGYVTTARFTSTTSAIEGPCAMSGACVSLISTGKQPKGS
jgi:hypothetical protein